MFSLSRAGPIGPSRSPSDFLCLQIPGGFFIKSIRELRSLRLLRLTRSFTASGRAKVLYRPNSNFVPHYFAS